MGDMWFSRPKCERDLGVESELEAEGWVHTESTFTTLSVKIMYSRPVIGKGSFQMARAAPHGGKQPSNRG